MSDTRWCLRRAAVGDERVLRDLRIQALTDAPHAFASTIERELARTTADWQRWMSPGVTFVVDGDRGAFGLVAGQRDAADDRVAHLMSMWVSPAMRGSGAADALVAALIEWAVAAGAAVVRLDVFEDNARARRFYERLGFRETGHTTVHDRDGRIELRMEHPLDVQSVNPKPGV